jgi:thiol-disulfide isomerase/thioredoxin
MVILEIMFGSVVNFFKRFNHEQKLILAFCILVIICTMYRDCILCKYVPKLDGFKMSRMEKFEDASEDEKKEHYEAHEEKEDFEDDEKKEHFEAEEKKEDFENMNKDSMVLFYAPWCPHCKTVMGDWAKLKKAAPRGVNIAKVNCEKKPELAEKHDVKGFPTIILFKGGKKVYFEGPRNLENFLEFIKSN